MKLAIKLAIILLMAMPCVAQVQIGNGGSMQVGANVSVTGCGVSAPCTVVQGGTGATTASSAWTNIFSGAGIATNCAVLSIGGNLYLRSPDGNCHQISVANGAISLTVSSGSACPAYAVPEQYRSAPFGPRRESKPARRSARENGSTERQ